MASLDLEGFDSFLKDLSLLDFDRIAPDMIKAGAPILEENIRRRSSDHEDSGDMAKSIKPTAIKKYGASGYRLTVRPTGQDEKGVRNMEKMCYLEYGTVHQGATPVLSPAVEESEEPVAEAMWDVFHEKTKELQI